MVSVYVNWEWHNSTPQNQKLLNWLQKITIADYVQETNPYAKLHTNSFMLKCCSAA